MKTTIFLSLTIVVIYSFSASFVYSAINTLQVSSFDLGTDISKIEEIDYLIDYQNSTFDSINKFEYQAPYKLNNTEYTTHEYVTPSGNAGYQIITKDTNSINSYGYGEEAQERTYSIMLNIATTTPIK